MKKYFIFAAVATAGLFASCSSSDDFANEGAQNPNVDERQEIRLNLATPGAMATRGTGTVGGVGTSTNVWRGQKINVFMFTKSAADPTTSTPPATTLNLTDISDDPNNPQYLYDNAVMITPGSAENLITGMGATAELAEGQAMIEDGTINYYPSVGNFDFFGYHVDGANGTADVDKTTSAASLWTIPFTIDGTQDLMSTKAALVTGQAGMLTSPDDYYSAKSARKGVDPTLTFKHLLTRLQFSVKAGNDEAAGYTADAPTVTTMSKNDFDALDPTNDAAIIAQCTIKDYEPKTTGGTLTDTEYDALTAAQQANWDATADDAHEWTGTNPLPVADYNALTATEQGKFDVANYTRTQPATTGTIVAANAVKVKSIQVLSENTKGNLAVAWTGDLADYEKITWDANQPDEADRWLTLMERPVLYNKNDGATIVFTDFEAYKDVTTAYADLNETTTPKKSDVDAAMATATAQINLATYNTLSTVGKAKYTIVANTEKEPLVALTKTAPTIDGTETGTNRYPQTRVGESIILSPGAYTQTDPAAGSATSLKMKVTVVQNVPTNWNTPLVTTEKEQSYDLVINAPTGGFLQNTSYNVILTVYGLERIDVVAVITPWNDGGNLTVGED